MVLRKVFTAPLIIMEPPRGLGGNHTKGIPSGDVPRETPQTSGQTIRRDTELIDTAYALIRNRVR